MFPGLMSRWMMPFWKAYSSARMHLKMISTTLASGSRLPGLEVLFQRLAGDVLHHQVAAVGLDHRVVDIDDVRVAELAGERGFGDERLVHDALGIGIGPLLELQHLDGDVSLREGVAREVHAARGPDADLADDRILADRLLRRRGLDLHEVVPTYLATSCRSSASA